MTRPLTRRALLRSALLAGLSACGGPAPAPAAGSRFRLAVRSAAPGRTALRPGTSSVRLRNGREGLLHVPSRAPRGLVVALHGAGGDAADGLGLVRAQADRLGLVVLAPASARSTWAAVTGGADPDTPAVAAALQDVLARQPVERPAVAGFSDGASYALTLGLANGDLFGHVVAFSPGFEAADRRTGRPELFLSHGTRDDVLPVDRTSRRLVPALRRDGYQVIYREFDGGHVVPREVADEALERAAR